MKRLKRYVLTGIIFFVFAGLAAYAASVVYNVVRPLRIVSEWIFGYYMPGSEILTAILLIIAAGAAIPAITRSKLRGIAGFSHLHSIKQMAEHLQSQGKDVVVLVPAAFCKGYMIGFTARSCPAKFKNSAGNENVIMVSIPQFPPLSWTIVLVSEEEIIETGMTIQEAMASLFTMGMMPELPAAKPPAK